MSLLLCSACEHRISQVEFLQRYPHAGPGTSPNRSPAVSDETRAAIERAMSPYALGPGDVLAIIITVAGQNEGPPLIQTRVDDNGRIELPLIGELEVAGLTLGQAEKAIKQAYVPDYHRQALVHMELTESALTQVLVTGAVVAPGLVELRRNERNLLYSTARAGGMTQASSGVVMLQRLRDGGPAQTFDLSDTAELRAALELPPLNQGDIVTVAAAEPNTVFVGGLVNLTSPQQYPPGTEVTVLQAIAAAGGLRTDLIPVEATLVRRIDGEEVFVKLNLDRISRGEDPNLQLAAGDILWVPHTPWTRLHQFFNETVYLSAGATYNVGYSTVGADYHHDLQQNNTSTLVVP